MDSESESAATALALRKWMDGAMYTKDGSMGEMGLRRCIVMVGNDFAIEMDKKGCVWPMQASYRVVKGGDGVEYCIHYPDSKHQDIIPC